MKSVMLIDGKNYCYRHHYTHAQLSSNGRPTSVLFGAPHGLLTLAKHLPGVPFVFVWDGFGKTWRHRLASKTYKANRVIVHERNQKDFDALHAQLPILKTFMTKIGFRNYEIKGLEGDDLVGLLVAKILEEEWFDRVIIHSSDRDFYQFIGKKVRVLKGVKDGQLNWASQHDIEKEFGVPCCDFTKLRAIIGDTSDNIPKVFDGIGPKTAAQFVLDGLDASCASFDLMPKSVQKKFKSIIVRKKEIPIQRDWKKLHLNYQLSQIVTSCDDKHLDENVRERLKTMFSKLKRKSFYRKKYCLTDENFQYMTRFLASYEMAELMGRRHELWRLP